MVDVLNVKVRKTRGSRQARKLRAAGQIPGTVYGHGEQAVSIAASAEELVKILRHGAHVVDLQGEVTDKALIKALQWDTFGVELVHVDLNRVSADERVQVELPIELRGSAPGVKEGGVIEHLLHQVEVDCPVISIPDKLQLNINSLKLNQTLTLANIELPEGVKIVGDLEQIVAQCVEPKDEEEAAEPGAAEPELIGRKPAEEEEAEEK